jgi:hypothetical protein
MPAQKRELKRNYIGLVSDETDPQYAANARPQSRQPMKDYLRGLLAAVLERRGEAR